MKMTILFWTIGMRVKGVENMLVYIIIFREINLNLFILTSSSKEETVKISS